MPRYCNHVVRVRGTEQITCSRIAGYMFEGHPPSRCVTHKEKGMISSKTCQEPGCTFRAAFGFTTRRVYCRDHARFGMMNLDSKKCDTRGCYERPLYGAKNGPLLYCKKHCPASILDIGRDKVSVQFTHDNKCTITFHTSIESVLLEFKPNKDPNNDLDNSADEGSTIDEEEDNE